MKKGRYTFWCNLIIKVLFEINYYIFRMIGISTKWLAPNFYEVPKEQYKKYNLVDYKVIVEKEKKRLGVKHKKITLNDIGLSLGSKDNDLFKLV